MHPVLISVGGWTLSTYGALVAAGYLAAIAWLKTQIPWMPGMTEDKFWTMIYGIFFGAIAGGKLLYVAVSLPEFLSGRLQIFRDFRYGFVFFGGLLGAIAMGFWVRRRIQVPYLATADFCGAALPLGHAIGRLGCLASGCCYGKPTTLPWGVVLGGHPLSTTPERFWGIALHPTQLYESFANLAIAGFLARWALPRAKNGKLVPGAVFLGYIVLYSAARFVIEFYRGDDRGWSYGSLWISQWAALACIAVAGVLLLRRGVFAEGR